MKQQAAQEGMVDPKKAFSILLLVAQALSATIEVFAHRGFGARYLGLQAALAIPLMFGFSLFFPGCNTGPLMAFLVAYIAMCVLVRIGITWRHWRGKLDCHSRYTGRPRVMWILRRVPEAFVKRLEAAFVFALGGAIHSVNEPLGAYLMCAGASLFISVTLALAYDRQRALDLKDAMYDQACVLERFHGLR